MPALGLSLFLIAIGAILAFAVNVDAPGISLPAVGVILMFVGLLGLLLVMLSWTSMSPWGRRTTTVYDEEVDVVVPKRRVTEVHHRDP